MISICLLSIVGPLGFAASQVSFQELNETAVASVDSFSDWVSENPGTWVLRRDMRDGRPALLFGGHAPRLSLPSLEETALGYLRQTSGFFEIDPATFSVDRVSDVRDEDEGGVGFSVRFTQSIGSTPVEGAILQVGLADDLGMISLSCINVIREGTPVEWGDGGLIGSLAAEDQAVAWASAIFSDVPLKVVSTELVWLPGVLVGNEAPELCYGVVLEGTSKSIRERVFVSAGGHDGVVLHHSLVFSCGGECPLVPVSGTVMAETEEYPGSGHMAVEMPRMRVEEVGSSQNAETSMNGFFAFNTSGSPPHSLRFVPSDVMNNFEVQDNSGLLEEVLQVSGTGQQIDLNASPTEEKTAVYNVFSVTQAFKDSLNMIGPGYPDFNSEALNAGANYGPSEVPHGNAFFSGGEIMFAESGSGFENMAFETVIVHELGHWMYSTKWIQGTIGSNGLQEGLADVWAMYFSEQSQIGQNFSGPGTFVRDGNNTAQWCRNSYGGCNLDPHEDGLPLMGALWEFYGLAPGAAVELLPQVTSTNSFGFVDTRIRDLWIAYDDDDHNLLNGTPHYGFIEPAFLNHGWEPFGANAFEIQHQPLPDSTTDTSPFDVFVDVPRNPDFSFGTINSVELSYWTAGSGNQITVPMILVSGDTYSGQIPAIASPVAIQYSVSANYVAGPNSYQVLSPPEGSHSFRVGITRPLYYSEFEAPSGSDQGWTHGDLNNPSFDDWQREEPGGNQGVSFGALWVDPETPATTNTIWGTDIRDTWDGAYRSGVNSFLQSPEIDASGAVGLSLAFDRWASFAPNDELRIMAVAPGGQSTSLWAPPLTLRDEAWSRQYIELPPALDGQVFRLRFELESDSGNNYGGWGIDNVEVTSLNASPSGANPSNTITCAGETSYSVGQVPVLELDGGTPSGSFEVRVSLTFPPGGWLSGSHLFDLGPNFVVVGTGTFDSSGSATYAFPAAASTGQIGSTFYAEVVENGPPVQDSNYMSFKVWP